MELLELNKDQQKAFNELSRAIKKCKKLKIGFFSVLEKIYAYDKNLISEFGDDNIIPDFGRNNEYKVNAVDADYPFNYVVLGGCSYADDQNMHRYKLTEKGREVYNQ